MFQIIINNQLFNIGTSLPSEIYSLIVLSNFGIQVPREQVPLIKAWLNQVISNLTCAYVEYNGTLIPTSYLKSF